MTALLVFLLCLYSVLAQSPSCPNGQIPKLDQSMNPIQCLPGTSQHVVCGPHHTCYFNGLNYMCCPSNEPNVDNQPTCPYPKMTVLDVHGLPLKCSSRVRQCPGPNMHCSDVGLGYICCEMPMSMSEPHPNHNGALVVHPKTTRPPPARQMPVLTTEEPMPEEELECPANTIGLLNSEGHRVICNRKMPCPGSDTFCHGEYKRSICCQTYGFAASILDAEDKPAVKKPSPVRRPPPIPEQKSASSFVESRSPFKPKSISVAMRRPLEIQKQPEIEVSEVGTPIPRRYATEVQRTAELETILPVYGGRSLSMIEEENELKKQAEVVRSWQPESTKEGTQAPRPTTPLSTTRQFSRFTHTTPIPKKKTTPEIRRRPVPSAVTRRLAFGVPTANEAQFHKPTARLPSEVMNVQDKHALAHQLLSYQIRNGWPYDERFYRPGADAYNEDQKAEIARMRFINH